MPAANDRCESAICRGLLGRIEASETSIDFAVYGMRKQTRLLEALESAQARGVVVRGVVDRQRDGKIAGVFPSTDRWVRRLGAIRDDLEAEKTLGPDRYNNRIMHNKFFVIDKRWVWTGSSNISDTGTGGSNANVVALVDSPQLAAVYLHEFDQMWSGRFHQLKERNGAERLNIGGIPTTVLFSPQAKALNGRVRQLIATAQRRIDVAMYYLTHEVVANELIGAHKRGVSVRVIIDAASARSLHTKHERLRRAGIRVKVEKWGSKMHMKAAAVDGRTVVVGSMNWSFRGESVNDENTLIFRSPALAMQFETFFDTLWDSIPESKGAERQAVPSTSRCEPTYPDVCIPPIDEGDLDCPDIPYRRFAALPPDPHGFDRDKDGIACEWD